jgi:hypothetical protein
LLAAAQESGLVEVLNEVVTESSVPRLANSHSSTRQQLMLTLLFMNVFEVRRAWDLRSYSGDGLALLSERKRAYGYVHTERFLTQIAQSGLAERLTDSLAAWTSQLWPVQDSLYYVDGHKKPVYSDSLLPRGLVGRLDKILGCRALTLLMDAAGHPLLVLTARGDQHLTLGLPAIVERYEQALGQGALAQIIVDREGMSGAFLKELSADRTVITLLRSDQYQGLDSFSQVGDFVPLELDRTGKVVREVAPAHFTLSSPEQPGETVLLFVALIRDWRKQVRVPPSAEAAPLRWDADLDRQTQWQWLQGQFEATAAPVLPKEPKLIPVVSTASTMPPVELAAVYGRRWMAQENIIRDFLLPLGLDINHGYAKTPVENSEVAKRRAKLHKRLDTARKGAQAAHRKQAWNAKRGDKLWREAKAYADAQDRQLALRLNGPDYAALERSERWAVARHERAQLAPDIQRRFQRAHRTLQRAHQLWDKYERDCAAQRQLLRDLDTLDAQARTMFELDNAKDQIMSVLKLSLVNLVMWVRDRCFPSDYAAATTTRLLPFFRLPGRVLTFDDHVLVTLRPFNDRALNRDLAEFCQRVNAAHLCLPSGKSLIFRVAESTYPTSNMPP